MRLGVSEVIPGPEPLKGVVSLAGHQSRLHFLRFLLPDSAQLYSLVDKLELQPWKLADVGRVNQSMLFTRAHNGAAWASQTLAGAWRSATGTSEGVCRMFGLSCSWNKRRQQSGEGTALEG